MLSQQDIEKMLDEMGLGDYSEKNKFAEYDSWTRLVSDPTNIQLQTFIEITANTTMEDEQRSKHSKLGRDPERDQQVE